MHNPILLFMNLWNYSVISVFINGTLVWMSDLFLIKYIKKIVNHYVRALYVSVRVLFNVLCEVYLLYQIYVGIFVSHHNQFWFLISRTLSLSPPLYKNHEICILSTFHNFIDFSGKFLRLRQRVIHKILI